MRAELGEEDGCQDQGAPQELESAEGLTQPQPAPQRGENCLHAEDEGRVGGR
jgi:hypothetical protein